MFLVPRPGNSPLCPRIEPRKRPAVKLDFGIINAIRSKFLILINQKCVYHFSNLLKQIYF